MVQGHWCGARKKKKNNTSSSQVLPGEASGSWVLSSLHPYPHLVQSCVGRRWGIQNKWILPCKSPVASCLCNMCQENFSVVCLRVELCSGRTMGPWCCRCSALSSEAVARGIRMLSVGTKALIFSFCWGWSKSELLLLTMKISCNFSKDDFVVPRWVSEWVSHVDYRGTLLFQSILIQISCLIRFFCSTARTFLHLAYFLFKVVLWLTL